MKHKDEVFLAASIIVYERLEVDCNNEKSQLASVVRGFQPDDIYYVLDKAHSISRGLIQNIRMELQEIKKYLDEVLYCIAAEQLVYPEE